MPQIMTLTSSINTCGQKQKRQNEMICIFLMDIILWEHHITRFAVWNQTGLVRNGRIDMVTVPANSTRLWEHEITGSHSDLVHNHVVITQSYFNSFLLSSINAPPKGHKHLSLLDVLLLWFNFFLSPSFLIWQIVMVNTTYRVVMNIKWDKICKSLSVVPSLEKTFKIIPVIRLFIVIEYHQGPTFA